MTDGLTTGRALIVHASESWYASVLAGRFDFFTRLADHAALHGISTYVIKAERGLSGRLIGQERHLNIIIGPRGPVGPGVWHAHPGYVRGFWYLDPMGVNMQSSLHQATFDPDTIDPVKARWFFNGVSGFNLRQNRSKFVQAPRAAHPLPRAKAVVYLQEIERFQRPVHWLDSLTILKVAAESGARVYVKLHPAQSEQTAAAVAALVAQVPALEFSTASIHDLSAVSDVVITQNSAAGFEALMQKKPVITCARADYHHATLRAATPEALTRAIGTAARRMAGFPFDRYLYWFLGLNQLEPQKPEFADRAWQRLTGQHAP